MQAQVVNPDELMSKVFACLQAKDEKAFLSLCPDSAQLVQVMKRLAEGIITDIKADVLKDVSPSSTASLDNSLASLRSYLKKTYSPKEIQKITKEFQNSFRSIIADGEKRGIDWTATAFINYTFDSTRAKILYGQTISGQSGYQSFHSKINFKADSSTHQIWFRDMLFVAEENKWYAGALEMLVLEGDEVREVVVQSIVVDEPPPPPPPPPPSKKKTKSKISSAKKKWPK